MRNPGGYAIKVDPDFGTTERDSFTCAHCNSIVFVKPKMSTAEMGGYCRLCMKPVCKNCADKSCTPFERKLEQMESRDRLMRTVFGG